MRRESARLPNPRPARPAERADPSHPERPIENRRVFPTDRSRAEPTLLSPPPLAGHSMSSKSVPGDARAPLPTRADLQAELDALRRQPRSKSTDAAKKDLKKRLKAANA